MTTRRRSVHLGATRFIVLSILALHQQAVRAAEGGAPEGSSPAASFPVKVEIFEALPAGKELELREAEPVEEYAQRAFGFARFPTKYSANALPLDRSSAFVIRASLKRALPPGEYQFRLRAKGTARLSIDGESVLTTKPQQPNSSGNDPVPPPVERGNSPLRPAPYPHQEVLATVRLNGQEHAFALSALIGGKGLVPSPGELSVSFGRPGEVPKMLGSEDAPLLTDEGWASYVKEQSLRHRRDDAVRRQALSAGVRGQWDEYHERVRECLEKKPGADLPKVTGQTPVFNEIDLFIGARLEKAGAAPTMRISDLEFLRRITLDTIGVVPSAEEVKLFLKEPPEKRRQHAMDRLLAHPGWADHWVSYWQDVLAENPGILKPDLNNSGPFRWWLHQSFSDNIPFDRLAAELIQMEGSVYLGAPAAFKLATLNDSPMAAKADILSQAFLGEKLSCARCHDAPDHPHKQEDTFSFAAMLEGKPVKLPASSTVPFVEGFRKPRVEISLKPGEEIPPHWPFEQFAIPSELTEKVPASRGVPETRRQIAATMVSPENERFAKVIVNRVWKRYFGAGLVEPAEDWYGAKASHPELLDFLARRFMWSGYDLKALARLIFSSHAYQRAPLSSSAGIPDAEHRLFAGPMRRRMSAEQLVDSLFGAAGKHFDCEELNLNPAGNRGLNEFLNLGVPERAWEFTALMNERDRPALALPVAQSIVDVLTTFGWRQSRMNPVTVRQDAPSPMQTLLLANGVVGTRITRLSDSSAFTEMALRDVPLEELVPETFLRILSRPPTDKEFLRAMECLQPVYADRKQPGALRQQAGAATDRRVSWGNHLSAEATVIRMEEERRLRMGEAPTERLKPEFRERYEDLLWSLFNSPEFTLVP
ncbi:MAG: DUF1553 domain-containing protein [Verrucomicrobia bacterium]|nr:DUF1553 domain-containing protein [Verrucomicrobiota bacterium]